MARGVSMMGRGPDIDPESFEHRQKFADQLLSSALATPQQPQLSWTQGASRLVQALMSGREQSKLDEDRSVYKKQRMEDMQTLGRVLSNGGDFASALPELRDPNSQNMALSLAKSKMDSDSTFGNQMKLKGVERQWNREDKGEDRAHDFNKMEVENEYKGNQAVNKSQLDIEEKAADPIKGQQKRLANLARAINDPNLKPELKDLAQQEYATVQKTLTAMQPPKTSVTVDASQKAEDAGLKKEKEKQGEFNAEATKINQQAGAKAFDSLQNYNRIIKEIESGVLTNQNTTSFGQGLSTAAARLGIPNNSAALSQFVQNANDQLVQARMQLQGQGQISDRETLMLAKTVLQENDTIEATRAKLHTFKQVAERQKQIGDLTRQWIDRFGALSVKSPDGQSFNSTVARLVDSRPIKSFEETQAEKQHAASQAAGAK